MIAPTGGGKTLAGFLPSLIELAETPPRVHPALHTLYISPLKALATDVARNLGRPVEEMQLDITLDTRTGDTPRVAAAAAAGEAAGHPADDAGAAGAAGGVGACAAVLRATCAR